MISAACRGLSLVVAVQFALLSTEARAQGTDVLYDNASDGSPVVQLINKAKSGVDIEIYEMGDMNVLTSIQNAINRGVKVRIIQEGNPFDGNCQPFTPITPTDGACANIKKFVTWARQKGAAYVPFETKTLCAADVKHCWEHGKMVIADSAMALISTGNFNASNLCDTSQHPSACNRDYTVLTTDPNVVKSLETIFQFDLDAKPYDLKRILSSTLASRITVSPFSMAPLVSLIQSARTSVLIQNQYLNDPTLNQALIDAAKRGVKVFVDVTSICYFKKTTNPDGSLTPDAQLFSKIYSAFEAAGIQSRMFTAKMVLDGLPGYLHAKAILVDGSKLWVGSVNGSTQSLNINREFGIYLSDANSVRKFSQHFSDDFKNPNSEDWKESLACKFDNPK